MQLSRLVFDPGDARARRDLADPYEMHRSLARVFALDDAQPVPRFLWRQEVDQAWARPTVLVQSSQPARWELLAQQPGYVRSLEHRRLPELEGRADQRCRFRLVANPTVTRDNKRYGLASEEAQLAWLERQGQRHGFAVEMAMVTSSGSLIMPRADRRMCLQQACFEGYLKILDPPSLRLALEHGIGPGKAFGMGLLSLGLS